MKVLYRDGSQSTSQKSDSMKGDLTPSRTRRAEMSGQRRVGERGTQGLRGSNAIRGLTRTVCVRCPCLASHHQPLPAELSNKPLSENPKPCLTLLPHLLNNLTLLHLHCSIPVVSWAVLKGIGLLPDNLLNFKDKYITTYQTNWLPNWLPFHQCLLLHSIMLGLL
ncbi:hypothetical protein F5148DRAFT_222930 [Russula earlei]|uniref:Uncharacterized protein n=1 Tax=Russula earlei TaxID=71964 RepID=A0ACC0U424_9AGAM|nr:hypothetical protein F5148DRAFT_222930 [Russula earlei]